MEQQTTPEVSTAPSKSATESQSKSTTQSGQRIAFRMGAFISVALILLLIIGVAPRVVKQAGFLISSITHSHDLPQVAVVATTLAPKTTTLQLPGNVQGKDEASIYARVSGFLKKWYVDIGDKVTNGQLMASIEAPDLDAQVMQAKNSLAQARALVPKSIANTAYNNLTARRFTTLANEGAVTRQQADETRNAAVAASQDMQSQKAATAAAQSNLDNLSTLQGYEQVRAPFDGIVTARSVDTGDLVTSGSTTSTTILFKVARIDTVRIFLDVPQRYVPLIHDGQPAKVTVSGIKDKTFDGTVARNANALDPTARTLRTEVDVPNPAGELEPGMYAQISIELTRDVPPVLLPSNALVTRPDGTMVATVDEKNRVHWQKIELGRDYGDTVEVHSGLVAGQKAILNPSDQLQDNDEVKPTLQPVKSTPQS
jgi:RND family efflux transporter MFP subunit